MSVNLIDSSNIEVKQSGSDISLDLGSEVVVDSIRTKNMFDSSTLVQGDITNGTPTLRMGSRQALWLEPGTYTLSTNMTSTYQFLFQIQNVGVPPLSSYPTYIYETGWQTAGTTSKTFTINTAGWGSILLRKADNSAFSSSDIATLKGFNYQLETGSSASTYTPFQDLTGQIIAGTNWGTVASGCSGSLPYIKIGNVVFLSVMGYKSSSNITAHDTLLGSNLPKATTDIVFLSYRRDMSKSIRMRITTNGELKLHYSEFPASSNEIYGMVVYTSSE